MCDELKWEIDKQDLDPVLPKFTVHWERKYRYVTTI